jgi:AraC family transcriptional activator of tynA and feaB
VTITPTISSLTDQPTPEEIDLHWQRAVRDRLLNMDLRPAQPAPALGSIEERDLGDLLITDWVCPPAEGVRGSNLARRDDDVLLLLTPSAGRQIIETPDETLVLRPGTVLLMSTQAMGKFIVPQHLTKRTVRIPTTILSPFDTGGGMPAYLLLETTHSPLAALLQDFIMGMDRHVEHMSAAEIEGTRTALLALIAGLIRASHAEADDSDLLPLLRRQLEAWIVDHLTTGTIRVADLATAHHVAPRTVHRAFAATGDTAGAVVRKHRLTAARADLVNTNHPIAAIAHRWGFSDASHLGREFRREFSLSPGEYRDIHGFA